MDYYDRNDFDLDADRRHKKEKSGRKVFLAGLAGALFGVLMGAFGLYYWMDRSTYLPTIEQSEIESPPAREILINTDSEIYYAAAVAEKAMDTVVGIVTKETYNNAFFGPQTTEGIGSGVIVDSNGFILTNSHVVSDGRADSIIVKFVDGSEAEGQVLWQNTTLDLAVVKVDKSGLKAAELGDSDELIIGEPVVAIGNPLSFELDRTVTNGIVSGLNRSITLDSYTVMKPLIQTNASINPGNSGGPLLNAEGKVIGINTAKITSAEGLGFSIPINIAKGIVEDIIEEGFVSDVYMGIRGVALNMYERQLNVTLSADHGVVVVEVIKESPAQKSRLQSGDVIQKMDNERIEDMGDIQRYLFKYKPGDSAILTIVRDGETIEIEMEFEKKPDDF